MWIKDSTSGGSIVNCSEMSGFVAVVVVPVTYGSGFKYSKCNGEVEGDGEDDLLSEWYLDLDLLAIHSSRPSF